MLQVNVWAEPRASRLFERDLIRGFGVDSYDSFTPTVTCELKKGSSKMK